MSAGTPFDKQSNQFGLFLNEIDPLSDLNSPKFQSRQQVGAGFGGIIAGQNFFSDLTVLNHSAT